MLRLFAASWVLALVSGCQTTVKSRPAKLAQLFDEALPADAALAVPAPGGTVDAVAFDFPRARKVGLQGRLAGWLSWLDERSPRGAVESLPNVGTAGVEVDALVNDVVVRCRLDSATAASAAPNVTGRATVKLGETSFDVALGAAPTCVLGRDVLGQAVLVVPTRPAFPVLLMVPRE